MLFGRIVGWVMMYCGAVLLLQYKDDWAALKWEGGPPPDPWNVAHESALDYIERSVREGFSHALSSAWTIAALVVLGAVMVWVCRRKPRHELN